MRLRVARKVILADRRFLLMTGGVPMKWDPRPQRMGRHRESTFERAYARIRPVHRRHFGTSVLRPISHRQRNRPYAWEGPAPHPEWR